MKLLSVVLFISMVLVSGCSALVPAQTPGPDPNATVSTVSQGIDPQTGQYKNFFIGLVKDPLVEGGNGCYDPKGDFIVLINNNDAKNPTYSDLVNFLQSNKTDGFPYRLSALTSMSYTGAAEDKIDLNHVKGIIDGTIQPGSPDVCADFAERLHNDAEMAGIRCGFVTLPNLDHAINVFETTDKGLVFIDDTGKSNSTQVLTVPTTNSVIFGQPTSWDKVAYIEDGKPYGLISLGNALYFGLDYTGYQNWLAAKGELDTLDAEYNNLAAGRTVVPQDIYKQLQNIQNQETALGSKLGGFWDSLGVVSSYSVTWNGSWRNRN